MLQDDLNRFSEWCTVNGLWLNVKKGSKVSFFRTRNKIAFGYLIENDTLLEYDNLRDLRVTFQSNLQFATHIDQICLKGTKTLGFSIRTSNSFNDINYLRVLFCVLV